MSDQVWNFSTMEQSSGDLTSEAAKVTEILAQEASQVQLVSGYWGGAGSEAWQQQQSRWHQKAADVNESLARLCTAVQSAAEVMTGVEANVEKMFS